MQLRLPRARARALVATCLVLLAALAASALARASDDVADPAARWPVGGPALQTAMAVAADYWGIPPCHGQVAVAWEELDPAVDAQAVWANDAGPYADATRNTGCELSLSVRGQWDWPKLCTIVVHETGHLTGHDHVADPADVMYFTFMQPLRQCAETPEPAPAAAPTPAPEPTPAAAPKPARKAAPKAVSAAARRRAAQRRAAKRAAARRRAARHAR